MSGASFFCKALADDGSERTGPSQAMVGYLRRHLADPLATTLRDTQSGHFPMRSKPKGREGGFGETGSMRFSLCGELIARLQRCGRSVHRPSGQGNNPRASVRCRGICVRSVGGYR